MNKELEVLDMIIADCEQDVKDFEGREFNGRTLGELHGQLEAKIQALAKIIKKIIKGEWKMKYLIILLLLSGCTMTQERYDSIKKTMADQQMERLDNMERGLINEAKQYQR